MVDCEGTRRGAGRLPAERKVARIFRRAAPLLCAEPPPRNAVAGGRFPPEQPRAAQRRRLFLLPCAYAPVCRGTGRGSDARAVRAPASPKTSRGTAPHTLRANRRAMRGNARPHRRRAGGRAGQIRADDERRGGIHGGRARPARAVSASSLPAPPRSTGSRWAATARALRSPMPGRSTQNSCSRARWRTAPRAWSGR